MNEELWLYVAATFVVIGATWMVLKWITKIVKQLWRALPFTASDGGAASSLDTAVEAYEKAVMLIIEPRLGNSSSTTMSLIRDDPYVHNYVFASYANDLPPEKCADNILTLARDANANDR